MRPTRDSETCGISVSGQSHLGFVRFKPTDNRRLFLCRWLCIRANFWSTLVEWLQQRWRRECWLQQPSALSADVRVICDLEFMEPVRSERKGLESTPLPDHRIYWLGLREPNDAPARTFGRVLQWLWQMRKSYSISNSS